MNERLRSWQERINGPVLLFVVLTFYIFASFAWWTFLLVSNNRYTLRQNKEIMEWRMMMNEDELTDVTQFPAYQEMKTRYDRQIWMILGEALIFFILLSIAVLQIWKSYRHELSLARQQRNFILSISHELKSPLASIKLALETLLHRQLPPERVNQISKNALSDADRLEKLVEDILLAARLEDSSFDPGEDEINFSELLQKLIEKYRIQHPGRSIQCHCEDELTLRGDRQLLQSLAGNLIENALKYSPENAPVELSLKADNAKIIFEVKDYGNGIPADEIAHIFKRFYRIGNEDTRNTKGTGLGLFIVKQVADAMGARIEVLTHEKGGTIFRVCFPKDK